MRPIVEDLTPPVDPDRDHWRGGAHAAVTLVEYGDYECPYSRLAFRTIQRLERQFGGQLRFVFRHLPLTRIHPHALAAAHVAEAAALQHLDQVAATGSKWHRLVTNADEFPGENPTNEPVRLWLKPPVPGGPAGQADQ